MTTEEKFYYLLARFLFGISLGLILGHFFFTPVEAQEVNLEQVITEAAATYNLDPDLIKAVITVESNWNPNAIGSVGELGLMQLHPAHVKGATLAVEKNVWLGAQHLHFTRKHCPLQKNLTWIVCYNNGINRKPKHPKLHPYYKKIVEAYGQAKSN